VRRDERGVAFPSPVVLLSIVAVAMAGIAFVTTQGDNSGPDVETISHSPTASVTPTAMPTVTAKPKPDKPEFRREDVYVEVYNNSGIAGLATATAAKADGAGWNVVGSDNWYGTIPASTVYYPQRLEAAAKALAKDLGIHRLMHAVDPMRMDRLTVILTSDYS
jgi:hypothetical protein